MMLRAREPRGVRKLALWLALHSLFASSLAQGAGEGKRDYCMIGCSAHRLMGLRLPLDVPNTVYWWPGAANSKVRVEGPNIWEWKDIEESQRNQWHEITTTQRDDNDPDTKYAEFTRAECNPENAGTFYQSSSIFYRYSIN
nr:uncharacterized protein LOC113802237 [Penaeus vannamei]